MRLPHRINIPIFPTESMSKSLFKSTTGRMSFSYSNLQINLENFEDLDVPEDCPFVLTSPRSLEACRRLRIKPVDLLPDKIDEARKEILKDGGELTYETLTILRDAESERRDILESCRELRLQLIERDSQLARKGISHRKQSSRGRRLSLKSVLFEGLPRDSHELHDPRPEADQGSMYSSYQSTTEILLDEDFSDVLRFSASPPSPPSLLRSLCMSRNGLPPPSPKKVGAPVRQESPRHRRKERGEDERRRRERSSQSRSSSLSSKTKDLLKGLEDLSDHDRRILERLALKKKNEEHQIQIAEEKHKQWQEEQSHARENKKNQEIMWSSFVERKRRMEIEQNEQRMMEARRKMEESQNRLRQLIQEKEQRALLAVQDPKRLRSEQYLEWLEREEQRRTAVESALQELLHRDTRYRKDLADHLESRLKAVDTRREQLKAKEATDKSIANSQELREFQKRRHSTDAARKEQIETLRHAIHCKDMKIANFIETNEFLRKKIDSVKHSRGLWAERTQVLKRELEASMDSWRRKVLEVQVESIRRAEERVNKALEDRRLRLDADTARRFHRQRDRLSKVQDSQRRRAQEVRSSIQEKDRRMASYHRARERSLNLSKERARQTSELRQALISSNPRNYDYVDAIISRVASCELSETL